MQFSFRKPHFWHPPNFAKTLFWHTVALFVFLKMPKKHYKTGEKQWKKNLDQFLTLNLDQFLTLKPPNLGPVHWIGDSESRIERFRIVRFESCDSEVALSIDRGCDSDGDSELIFRDTVLLRFDSFFDSRCGISGDSRPAILGIVRFATCDSVQLSSEPFKFPLLRTQDPKFFSK